MPTPSDFHLQMLLMCVGHGFVEKLGFLKRKDAALDGVDSLDRTGEEKRSGGGLYGLRVCTDWA